MVKICINCSADKSKGQWYSGPICNSCYHHRWYEANIEQEKADVAEWRRTHKEQVRAINNAWHRAHPEQIKEINDEWIKTHQEQYKQYHKEWRQTNKAKINAAYSKRRAAKLQAAPKWLTEEQLAEIEQFYIESDQRTRKTGIQHNVDHIIPLQGKEISGLHVPWNLRVITRRANLEKGNKLES